ncbi:S-layer homology domain-containing protein, partial [Patescibacteria group bacterium]|nr:S-layer homology domain-containing protein [Patescibacteria group bacterium]
MYTLEKYRKFISYFLIAILLSLQLFQTSPALGAKPITRYSLVTLLVDENLWTNSNKYPGLSNESSKVSPSTMKYRILRYAEDIQSNLPYTKTLIVLTSPSESTSNIAATLEKFYREGDGTKDEINSLSGVVLIGDIPIPVVKKNENRFPSLYPYTDFDDKLYIFDETDFILNEETQNPQVEIWHGVINPPQKNEEGNKMLAEYFDKNHLFRIGDTKYGQFDQKLFYGDLTREVKSLNSSTFLSYQNLQKYAEDKTYMRYTKELALKIYQETNKKVFDFGDDQDNDGDKKINEDPDNGVDDDGDGEEGSPLHGLIDGLDNDGDGDFDEEDEGFYGLCAGKFQNCAIGGKREVTQKFGSPYYAVQKNSKYKVADSQDNNGDGVTDEGIDEDDGDPYLNIDNDLDGKIDEDTDRDNDKDKDGKSSEDPPGDKNGDGCPGVCLVDEDLDQQDSDGDGFPNGDEKESGTDSLDPDDYPNLSHIFIFKIPRFIPDANRDNPNYATPKRKNWVDEWPSKSDSNCYDASGKFHPEWDDDEDGRCDEDGTSDDDNDGDGRVDEDKAIIQNEIVADNFKDLPDIDARSIIENYFSEFPELLQKYLAQINKYSEYSGRWERDSANVDDFSSIIGKRDSANRTYFLLLSTALEKTIDEIIVGIQSNQPIVTQARIAQANVTITEKNKNVTLKSNPNIEFTSGFTDFFSGNVDFINGIRYETIKDPLECSLFRGTSEKTAAGSKLVLFNKIYNPITPKDKDGKTIEENKDDYGYCIGKYYEAPSVCVPEKAKKPVLDFGGSLKMDDWYESATDYRACFDLKEKKHFEEILKDKDGNISIAGRTVKYIGRYQKIVENNLNKKKELMECKNNESDPSKCKIQVPALPKEENRPLFRDRYKPLNEIVVFNDTKRKIKITLADVAKALKINADDFLTFNEQIFNTGDPKLFKKTLTVNNPLGANNQVKSIQITIDRIRYAGNINSPVIVPTLVKHKAPFSFEGIDNLTELSVDNAISEQIKQHTAKDLPIDNPRYLTFKDKNGKFQKINYPNIFKTVSDAEAKLMIETTATKIASLPGAPTDTKNKITKILEEFSKKDQLSENINWKNANIDQKHQLIFTNYLTAKPNSLYAPQAGYEAAYLVMKGQDGNLEYAINPAIPEVDEDPTIKFPKQPEPKDQDDPTNQLAEVKPIMIFDWFAHIVEWLKTVNLQPRVTMMCQYDGDKLIDSDPTVGVSSNKTAATGSSGTVESYSAGQIDKNDDGIPDAAQNTKNLSLEIENNVLLADGKSSSKIYIYANDVGGKRNYSDGYTQVELQIIKGGEAAEIISNPLKNIAGGKAEFTIGSTLKPGEITVKAVSKNLKNKIETTSAKLITSDIQIKLSSFIRPEIAPEDNISPQRKLKNILILDDKDKKIVRVKAYSGEIEMLDNNHTLQLSPSKNSEPVKAHIIDKKTQSKIAVLMYVPFVNSLKEQNGIVEFTSDNSFLGTNYKLLAGSSNYEIKKGSDSVKFYPKKSNATSPPLQAEITKNGQIFLSDGLSLSMKKLVSTADYQSFIIEDGSDKIAEVFISADYENINIITNKNAVSDYLSFGSKNKLFSNAGVHLSILEAKKISKNWLISNTYAQQIKNDQDNDGLTDFQEFIIGTNPQKADTDDDGSNDSTEIQNNYDPKNADERLFNDLNKTDEAFNSIIDLYLKGIIRGYQDKTFKPNKFITREEFVKVDLSSACIDCSRFEPSIQTSVWQEYSKTAFPDNNITEGLKFCIAEGKNRGIIQGYKGKEIDGFFLPSKEISRAEATKVIVLTAGLPVPSNLLDGKPWHYNYVIGAMQAGIYPQNRFKQIDGKNVSEFKNWFNNQILSDGDFVKWLNAPITRGEFAIMVANIFKIDNCWIKDSDSDGLNNLAETSQYGTDPNNRDTDNGGVDDYTEVINKMNPLNAQDDQAYLAKGSASPAPEPTVVTTSPAILASPSISATSSALPSPFASPKTSPKPADFTKDTDEDGLSDGDEISLGLDPNNIDSDGGGIIDHDELKVYKTNPLDPIDDNILGIKNISQGFHAAAYKIQYDYITLPSDAEIQALAENVSFTDEILADGRSTITLRAQLQDLQSQPLASDHTSQIKIIAVKNSGDYASVKDSDTRKVANGKADFTVISKRKAGTYKVIAQSQNQNIPSSEAEIFVYPGGPAKITFSTQSSQIKADNSSAINASINLFDENGNLADYSIYPVSLKIEGPGELVDLTDENSIEEGVNTKVLSGKLPFKIKSTNTPGDISVTAAYVPIDAATGNKTISSTLKIKSVENLKLKLVAQKTTLPADGKSKTTIDIQAIDQNNLPLNNFTGKAEIQVSSQNMGALNRQEVLLINGRASIDFTAGNKTGQVNINAYSDLLATAESTIKLEPLAIPRELKIFAEQNKFSADPNSRIKIYAKIYDQNGNLIDNLSSGKMSIAATNATKDFVTFPIGFESNVKNGSAEFIISPTNITGPINLVISFENLLKSGIQLSSVNRLTAQDFYLNPPNVMHISLLGTDGGNVNSKDYLTGSMVFSKGKTLAATSLITQAYNYESVVDIKSSGNFEIINIGNFESELIIAPDSSPNILIYNTNDSSAVGKLFVKFEVADSPFKEKTPALSVATATTQSTPDSSSNNPNNLTKSDATGIYVMPANDEITTKKTASTLEVHDSNNTLATINKNGAIQINQPGMQLVPNQENNDFTLSLVSKEQGKIAEIVYHFQNPQVQITDLNTDKQKLTTGIYFAKAENLDPYAILQTYSGNSNRTKSGLKIVDTRFKDNSLSGPGMGYLSLEDSENAEAVGFREGNKHMLLLAAGNIIGEANKPYASEIGIVIGDPTLKFKNQNKPSKTGYTKDIGIQLLAGTSDIQSITKLDYNSDGLPDLFVAYADGRINLLENEYSYKHFKDQGTILNLTNGIKVIEKGDLDNDGYEDLVIVTQNGCKVGEVCVYWYQNKGGSFTPYNLGLNTDTQLQDLKVGDLNQDGYADIVTSDNANQIMVFYNNKGKIPAKGDLIADLDLNV